MLFRLLRSLPLLTASTFVSGSLGALPSITGAGGDELPETLEISVRAGIEHWMPWCEAADYRVDIEQDGRVVLISKKNDKRAEKLMELVRETLAAFDRILPSVELDPTETFLEAEWGVGEIVPDRDPVVLFELDRPDHMSSLLDHVRQESPRLSSWAQAQKGKTGFMHDHVLSAAWLSAPPELELGTVWRPQNELVNRLARMLLLRRFGAQPHWFKMGIAWRVEQEVMGDIYAFPGREEFVGVGEHTGWKNELKSAFKKRKKKPLDPSEFAGWGHGEWHMPSAQISWGLVRYLIEKQPEALPLIAEDFRKNAKAGSRVTHSDGRWELKNDYRISLEDQRAMIEARAGDQVFKDATEFFRKGR